MPRTSLLLLTALPLAAGATSRRARTLMLCAPTPPPTCRRASFCSHAAATIFAWNGLPGRNRASEQSFGR